MLITADKLTLKSGLLPKETQHGGRSSLRQPGLAKKQGDGEGVVKNGGREVAQRRTAPCGRNGWWGMIEKGEGEEAGNCWIRHQGPSHPSSPAAGGGGGGQKGKKG